MAAAVVAMGQASQSMDMATPRTLRRQMSWPFKGRSPNWKDFDRDLTDEWRRAEFSLHKKRVIINVSGLRFETQLETLSRFPDTLLGDPDKLAKYYDPVRMEYFFDRHRPSAEAILTYYQTGGILKRPMEVPVDVFTEELRFFEMGEDNIVSYRYQEGYVKKQAVAKPKSDLRKKIWKITEDPKSSWIAKHFSYTSVFFILLSTCVASLETLSDFIGELSTVESRFTNPFFILEIGVTAWFVLEMALRMSGIVNKKAYGRSCLGVLDIISVLPLFVNVIAMLAARDAQTLHTILRCTRMIRGLRILKLSRHSRGLKLMGKTLAGSLSDIAMLLGFMAILIVLFAAGIFFVEEADPDTHFHSIPEAFWWALVTMVTLGYGDMYPQTPGGKFVGSVCALAGILTVALPVPVIVTNFDTMYNLQEDEQTDEENEE
ncbi:potassium voltage-gated channel subfamily A member 1-like [Branchiostoma lanceolatum]|uniref:potassium voltage-gated channel subfamily A member 1-like n=1 Tax=Branchiostoma lanceolatum TaxID=7740 RepID=UPI0034532823